MAANDTVAERLRTAERRWTTVRGTFREWRRQALVDRAWHDRHHLGEPREAGETQARSGVFVTAVREDGQSENDPIVEHVLAVAAADQGRCLRAEALARTGEEWLADLVVIDVPWFWARTGEQVRTNDGNPHSQHGGAEFVCLLKPAEVPRGFDLSPAGVTDAVAGRDCEVVLARAKDPDPYGEIPGPEVLGMISGGRDFRLYIDVRTGIVMRAVKLVDGERAEIREFLDIAIDEPIDRALFQALT